MGELEDYLQRLFENPDLERSMRESLFSKEWRIGSGEELSHAVEELVASNKSKEALERVIEVGELTLQHIKNEPLFYFFVGTAYLTRVHKNFSEMRAFFRQFARDESKKTGFDSFQFLEELVDEDLTKQSGI